MEIKHLQYVLAIAKYKNLSYAARNLFITQPALSHQLNAIEKELGKNSSSGAPTAWRLPRPA